MDIVGCSRTDQMAKPAMPVLKLRQAGHQIGLFPLLLNTCKSVTRASHVEKRTIAAY
jgi:hypothetical protein